MFTWKDNPRNKIFWIIFFYSRKEKKCSKYFTSGKMLKNILLQEKC